MDIETMPHARYFSGNVEVVTKINHVPYQTIEYDDKGMFQAHPQVLPLNCTVTITLMVLFMWVVILNVITLVGTTLIVVSLILALVWVLVQLASAMGILASKGSMSILTSVWSLTSRLTSIAFGVVIIIGIFIRILFLLYLYWRGILLLLLSTFPSHFSFTLLCFHLFERLGNFCSSLSSDWAMWEYRLGMAVPCIKVGNAAVGGSHFLMICSVSFAFCVVLSQFSQLMRCFCIIVGIV